MPTSVKLLRGLTDEELGKVYDQFLAIKTTSGQPVPWREYVRLFGRDDALSTLMLAVNRQHPKDSRHLWLISIGVLSIAILTSILQ